MERIKRNNEPLPIVYACVDFPLPKKVPYMTGVRPGCDFETRLRIMAKVFPGKRIGTIYTSFSLQNMERTSEIAEQLGLRFTARQVNIFAPHKKIYEEFLDIVLTTDVYWELMNPHILSKSDLIYQIYGFNRRLGMPVVTDHDSLVGSGETEAKGLMAINDDFYLSGQQAG
ncbi:MAG: hypothetical protein GY765_33420, partial [bacterium]|nr:hypothetical protein [bacterium]